MAEGLWKDAEFPLSTEDLGEDPAGPDPWEAAVHNKVSEDDGHHEYFMRKSQRDGQGDAVFNGLAYKPVSVMMPVPEKEDNPYWGWFKKS